MVVSGNSPIVHMAALIPEASHRDRYVLVEKCWTAGDKILLDEFGCVASENSFVYANGAPDNSPRFSLRLPDWSVEFMCTVVYCENGMWHNMHLAKHSKLPIPPHYELFLLFKIARFHVVGRPKNATGAKQMICRRRRLVQHQMKIKP